jgi:hypothetical protein
MEPMRKKIFSSMIFVILIIQSLVQQSFVMAEEDMPQAPPYLLKVEPMVEDQPEIGYNEYDKYYADFSWQVDFPSDTAGQFVNLYMQEMPKALSPDKRKGNQREGYHWQCE